MDFVPERRVDGQRPHVEDVIDSSFKATVAIPWMVHRTTSLTGRLP